MEKSVMERKSIFIILAVLITAGVLFAGCATQSPATATPTPVPSVTTEITTAPMTTETTAVPTTIEITAAPTTQAGMMNIVETATADGRFTTLVAALNATHLDGNLSGPGPFTVFAPTDNAFKKLPVGTVDSLLKDPRGQLKQILLYHIVNRKLMAADVMRLGTINTLQGQSLLIGVSSGVIMVNGDAKVIEPDIVCSNGVIHVIDTVLAPQT
jgi:transforming growth factor-beta-induced protein